MDETTRYVYSFENGDGNDKALLGGKGANLCEMTRIGLPVPPGFVVTTEACRAYLEHGAFPSGLMAEVRTALSAVEQATGRRFGDPHEPLLVSVRSGSAMSMPGMMDTVLNLGLNAASLEGLIAQSGDARFARDAHRRFVQLFGKVVLGVPDAVFDEALAAARKRHAVASDLELNAEQLADVTESLLALCRETTGRTVPDDPFEQLELTIAAVFRSWLGKRAVDYRRQFAITPAMANGTAVNVCAMVFGNLGADSATGVAFTRNPATGERELYGEYLRNAQGEDVVAGIRTPQPVAALGEELPEAHAALLALGERLEAHFREVQDFEFTIERGRLYCLQTRTGKLNARATVVTSVHLCTEELITRERALRRVEPALLEQLLAPRLDPSYSGQVLAHGLAAAPGAACGEVVFDADLAEQLGRQGRQLILVREETKPEDIHGFFAAAGILTSRGGKTSHAAVVARGMGKPCVSGCEALVIDHGEGRATLGGVVLHEGDTVTIDGTTGAVYAGRAPTVAGEVFDELATLLAWADDTARLAVLANADTPHDAERARGYGAAGVGLCRTERMFNDPRRLPIVQEMILAESAEERQAALQRLLPLQRADFSGIFRAMVGLPVTVRLLDPPIHEFLPSAAQLEADIAHLQGLRRAARAMHELPDTLKLLDPELHHEHGGNLQRLEASLGRYRDSWRDVLAHKQAMLNKVRALSEVNPMLGHRGVRLGLSFPEIYEMQIRAVLEAAAECVGEGLDVHPEIMVPQVCTVRELERVGAEVRRLTSEIEAATGLTLRVRFGSMLEVVRACLLAGDLARACEFFSFGTNDLTQAVFSFSREDAEQKFLTLYREQGLLDADPFEALDREGVGQLMAMAVQAGRAARAGQQFGICGEHGGHPASIAFCHALGLDYVSCSAPRVPVARLAAAQAALEETRATPTAGV